MANPKAQNAGQPLYQARHRIPINITLFLALAVVVLGIYETARGVSGGGMLIVVGLGVAMYTWLASPRQYLVYPNSLVIEYGTPRLRVIPFEDISHLDMLSLIIGDRLRVRLARPLASRLLDRKRIILELRDPQAFHDQLLAALEEYRRNHPEAATGGQAR
ncbi:MAG: hypothetical protein FJ316_01735 [SAR202 cluster bacterium]|nr:hypothetical protein [SAR202 cluster bacterium]